MSDQNKRNSNDAYNELLKSFASFKNKEEQNSNQDEEDVKNNGEIYFSANSETVKPDYMSPLQRNSETGTRQHILIPEENTNIEAAVTHSNSPEHSVNRQVPRKTPQATSRTGGKKRTSAKKKQNKTTSILLVALIVVFVFAASFVIRIPLMGIVNDVIALNADDTQIRVIIEEGMDYKDIVDLFAQKNLISNSAFCKLFVAFRGYDKNRFDEPLSYPAGTYYLSSDMGVEGMLSEILNAGSKDSTVTLTFPEGYTVDQIIQKLSKNSVASSSALYAALDDEEIYEDYDFLNYITDKEERYRALEGYLYPDTYEFYIGENAKSVIKKFLNNFADKWTELYSKKAKDLNMTVDEIMIVASILEKEAYDAEQMPIIASIIYNRLESSAFPFINCDSTGQYISNSKDNIEKTGNYESLLKVYDTYQKTGLPVGPICNPGIDAIEAALYPDDTSYYYFLHSSDGKIYLAKTQAEHEANLEYLD